MKHRLLKIACGFAAAALAFTLAACDDSSSANNASGPESSGTVESSATANSSDTAESSGSIESSGTSSDSSLPDNSSSSMAVTCQALTLECYSAVQLCNKGLTEYCGSSVSNNSSSSSNNTPPPPTNSSSSSEETCKHVSDVDGGTCQDYDSVKDCATGAYAVCRNNRWTPAIIGDNCRPIGGEISVNDIKLTCNEDSYWEYIPVYNNCPPGNYSCQPPNYGCLTHPINGFSCNEGNNKVYQLTVTTRGAGDCLYQCSNGKYSVVMPPAPVGN